MAVWHQNYPKGVPETIDINQFRSLNHVIEDRVAKFGAKPAFSCMGATLSYKEVDQLASDFASYLTHHCGLKAGDRIAIQMPNVLQYPIVLFGALKAGLIVVNTNPLYTEREMEHQFNDSGAIAIVILENFAHQLEKVIAKTKIKHVITTEIGDLLPTFKKLLVNAAIKYVKKMVPSFSLPSAVPFLKAIELGKEKAPVLADCNLETTAFLQYTGGTTGVAKGAVLSHGNVIANMLQVLEWMKPKLIIGEEVILTPLPMYHIFSLSVNCMCFMYYGAHNILITNPRDSNGFVKTMKAHPFTVMSGVNTLYNALLNNPQFQSMDFSNLKISVAGATALQANVAKRWEETTGTKVIEGYGLTEASPVVCVNPVDGTDQRGTIGMPVPSTDIKLVDDDDKIVADGEAGELCVRGPQVMSGYWQRPEESAAILRDGWLYTGDIAVCGSDGFFKIVDRKKDMILVSGFNVYPNEIEDVVANHPSVVEVAAIGVADEKSGEAVKIFIVKSGPLTKEEIIDYCRKDLTGYKIPRHVEFRDELPKSNVGKILRKDLRE